MNYEEDNVEHANVVNVAPAVQFHWKMERIFANMDEAQTFIEAESCWSKTKTLFTKNGKKILFRCNKVKKRAPQCTAGIYFICDFEPNNVSVKLFRKNLIHNHENSA